MNTRSRREPYRHETHTCQMLFIQSSGELDSINPGSSENFERCVSATAYGSIRSLKQPDPRIQNCLGKAPHVRRWIYPREPGLIKERASPPVLEPDHLKICTELPLTVE